MVFRYKSALKKTNGNSIIRDLVWFYCDEKSELKPN